MKIKLHLGFIVALLVLFGTLTEQNTIANQQIVIQFSDQTISSGDTDATIEIVKKELQSLGANRITIGQYQNGQLTITYYSESNVESIHDLLSKADHFKFAYGLNSDNSEDLPENGNTKSFEFNISEIDYSNTFNWDFEGTEVVQLNQKSERFSNPNHNAAASIIQNKLNATVVKRAQRISNTIVNISAKNAYNIPEVRAGPSTNENS